MSCTRFHEDPSRIKKELEILTFAGRYALDRPGQGAILPYLEDPHIRLQAWGGNVHTGFCDLESELKGMYRPLDRDPLSRPSSAPLPSQRQPCPVEAPYIQESRVTHPAWVLRDQDAYLTRWETPWINPQAPEKVQIPFENNVSTRLLR